MKALLATLLHVFQWFCTPVRWLARAVLSLPSVRAAIAVVRKQHDVRLYLLLVPSTILLFHLDTVLASTWGELALVLPVVVAMALSLRKALLDHIDMSQAVEEAIKGPTGAGLVVLSVALVTSVIMISGVLWLRG